MTPTPTASPTPAAPPTLTASPTPTVDPAEEAALISAAEAQYGIPIARIGITGLPIPELIVPENAELYGWRPAEPLAAEAPDRPFLLSEGEPVREPEPWMLEAAAALVRAHARYHELDVSSVGDDSGELVYNPDSERWDRSDYRLAPALAALVVPDSRGDLLTSLARREAMRRGGTHAPDPYDHELVAINFDGRDSTRVHIWTYDWNQRLLLDGESEPGEPLWPALRTHWEFTWVQRGGAWLLDDRLLLTDRWFRHGSSQWLWPFIELVQSAHEPLALDRYEEWAATDDYGWLSPARGLPWAERTRRCWRSASVPRAETGDRPSCPAPGGVLGWWTRLAPGQAAHAR